MTRKTTDDFHPETLKVFDKYVHGDISRRDFLSSIAKYALLGLTAEGVLEALSPKFAEAQQILGNDPRLKAEYVEYPSPQGCLLYTSPSPRDRTRSRMPSSA